MIVIPITVTTPADVVPAGSSRNISLGLSPGTVIKGVQARIANQGSNKGQVYVQVTLLDRDIGTASNGLRIGQGVIRVSSSEKDISFIIREDIAVPTTGSWWIRFAFQSLSEQDLQVGYTVFVEE